MSKPQRVIVSIPQLIRAVDLPKQLGKALNCVKYSGAEGISSLELVRKGCLNPASSISELRKRGAVISKKLKETEDEGGAIHRRVAHYSFHYWSQEIGLLNDADITDGVLTCR